MRLGRPVASLAGNGFGLKWGLCIAVQGATNRPGLSRMTKQTLRGDRPVEIGRRRLLVPRRHVPDLALCVPGDRGLEEMVARFSEKSDSVITGADDVCDVMFSA